MFRWLFSFLLFFPWWALAQSNADCSAIDLTVGAEAPLAIIPRWNQGNTNLCYAYSAATLIDEYRFSRGDKDRTHITSPFLLALKTIEAYESEGSSLKGGKIEHAFNVAKAFGTCNSLKLSDHLGDDSTEALIKKFSSLYKAEEKNGALSVEQFLIKSLMPYCEEAKDLGTLPLVKLLFQPDASAEDVVQQVHSLLKTKIPVGINFCANVVTNPDHKGKMQDGKWLCEKNKNHSALIAGRKMIAGKCQFLIRDTGCEGYEKISPGRCHQGQYWVEADVLTQNLHGIFWLE